MIILISSELIRRLSFPFAAMLKSIILYSFHIGVLKWLLIVLNTRTIFRCLLFLYCISWWRWRILLNWGFHLVFSFILNFIVDSMDLGWDIIASLRSLTNWRFIFLSFSWFRDRTKVVQRRRFTASFCIVIFSDTDNLLKFIFVIFINWWTFLASRRGFVFVCLFWRLLDWLFLRSFRFYLS